MQMMPLRGALVLVALSTVLGGCFLWSDKSGPRPSPLPTLASTVKLSADWHKRTGKLAPAVLRPAVAGASVFAGASGGELARFEAGRDLWSVKAARTLAGGVAANGKLVVVSSAAGELLAFDSATGKQSWRVQLGGEVSGLPLVTDTLVVVRVGDNQVLAFDAVDGKQRWVYQRAQSSLSLRTHSGFARVDDAILAGFSGGKLVSLSLAGGFPRWESGVALPRGSNELERMADLVGEPVVRGDKACVTAYLARVACAETTRGSIVWTRDIASSVGADADDAFVYVTDINGAIHALDIKTGATAWRQDKLMYRGVGRPLVVGDYVVVADTLGWIHMLDRKDGSFVGRLDADSSGFDAPMATLGKGFVAQARDGTVYALSIAAGK